MFVDYSIFFGRSLAICVDRCWNIKDLVEQGFSKLGVFLALKNYCT